MKCLLSTTILLIVLHFNYTWGHLNLPTYISACSGSDANLDECAKKSANAAIPIILKGDKKYGIPNFIPLVLPTVDLQAGNNFNLKFKNLEVYGLEKCEVDKLHIDINNHKAHIKLISPTLTLKGPYEIKGKILVLPIEGKGNAKIDFTNNHLGCDIEWDLIKDKKGVEIAKVKNSVGSYDTKNVKFHFENLFNGDKKLGTEMNKVMNDNWSVVNQDLTAPLNEVLKQVCFTIVDGYFGKVPFNQVFV